MTLAFLNVTNDQIHHVLREGVISQVDWWPDDFLFESHENVPVKRVIPLKKSPVMLMKLVSEKMTMKHGGCSLLCGYIHHAS